MVACRSPLASTDPIQRFSTACSLQSLACFVALRSVRAAFFFGRQMNVHGLRDLTWALEKGDWMANGASFDANIQTAVLDALSEGLAAAIFICDRNDQIVFASQSVLQFFPVPCGLLAAGTRLRDFLGAVYDSGARFALGAPDDRAGGREGWLSAQIARHWKERADSVERFGQDRWVRLVTRRLPSGYGICLIRDVSEETKREKQWHLDLERVQLTEDILDTLPFAISVKDRNLTYAAVNGVMVKLLQRGAEEIVGKSDREVMPPDLAAMFELTDRRVLETGLPISFPEHVNGEDGQELMFITHKWRVGKPGRYFVVTVPQDVTGIADAGRLDSLRPGPYGEMPVRSVDYNTLRALPGQRVLLVTEDRALETRAVKVLSQLGFDACAVRSQNELTAFFDVARAADVRIDLVVLDSDMDIACLEETERNGIMALPLDNWQIANELGFSVARALNRAAISSESVSNEPEVVVLNEPLEEERSPVSQLDVLVVEDNDINRIVFSQIMDGLGFSHVIVPTGREAIEFWHEKNPRIILMDTGLPDMTGIEAARIIRDREAVTGAHVPIVGVMAQAIEGDRDACLAAGMDDTILKPVSPDMVEDVIRRLMQGGRMVAARA